MCTTLDDNTLWREFCDGTLPHAAWTHAAHLRVAVIHLQRMDIAHAIDEIRTRIVALNLAHGAAQAPGRGYHETITCAWMHVLASEIAHFPADAPSNEVLDRRPEFADKRYLTRYYSPELLQSQRARESFVQPDREPLPVAV